MRPNLDKKPHQKKMINLILTLLALTSNLVSAVTRTDCNTLCSGLNNGQSSEAYKGIGMYGDKCICKNAKSPALPIACEKRDPARYYQQNSTWDCPAYATCKTLCNAISYGGVKPYDYYNIGKYGDRCPCENPSDDSSDLLCKKSNASLANTAANTAAYYSPDVTGYWHCKKVSKCYLLCDTLKNGPQEIDSYNEIGNVGDKCSCTIKTSQLLSCEKFRPPVPPSDPQYASYYTPSVTGQWHCKKK